MYSLTNQVCSLDQARELHELGVRCESYFGWIKSSNGKDWYISSDDIDFADYYAYTCAELGVMLPGDDWFCDTNNWELMYGKDARGFYCGIYYHGKEDYGYIYSSELYETEAQARAAALTWLIKEGHIKADEVKL